MGLGPKEIETSQNLGSKKRPWIKEGKPWLKERNPGPKEKTLAVLFSLNGRHERKALFAALCPVSLYHNYPKSDIEGVNSLTSKNPTSMTLTDPGQKLRVELKVGTLGRPKCAL